MSGKQSTPRKPRKPRLPANYICFWWYAIPRFDSAGLQVSDEYELGRVIDNAAYITTDSAADSIPQSPDTLPQKLRCLYPLVYIPVRYGELSQYSQILGPDSEEARLLIQQRGADIANDKLHALNSSLNWNMDHKQRQRAIRKAGLLTILSASSRTLPGKVSPATTPFAYTPATSPLLADTPAIKYRPPISQRRRTNTKHRDSSSSPTVQVALRHESRGLDDNDHPHDRRTTAFRSPPPPPAMPSLTGLLATIPEDERPTMESLLRELHAIEEEDALLDRFDGLSKDVPIGPDFGYPMSAGRH